MNIGLPGSLFEPGVPDAFSEKCSTIYGRNTSTEKSIETSLSGTTTPFIPNVQVNLQASLQPWRLTPPAVSTPRAPDPVLNIHRDQTSYSTSKTSIGPPMELKPPQKKYRATGTMDDTGDADRNCDHPQPLEHIDRKSWLSFACPFYRRHPERHFKCMNLRMPRIADVKQHLKRQHSPRYVCSTCLQGFPVPELYEEHIRQKPCSVNLSANNDIVSLTAAEILKDRFERNLTPKGQWHKIWEALFGEIDDTQNPYYEGEFKEISGIIRRIWKEEAHDIINTMKKTRHIPPSCSDQLQPLLFELLDRLESRSKQKPSAPNSRELPKSSAIDDKDSSDRDGDKNDDTCHDGHRYVLPVDSVTHGTFPCPFGKHDPVQYHLCSGIRFTLIDDVMRHIAQNHLLCQVTLGPPIPKSQRECGLDTTQNSSKLVFYCEDCRMEFFGLGAEDRWRVHTSPRCTSHTNIRQTGVFLPEEFKGLKNDMNSIEGDANKWKLICSKCFPEIDPPPYVETAIPLPQAEVVLQDASHDILASCPSSQPSTKSITDTSLDRTYSDISFKASEFPISDTIQPQEFPQMQISELDAWLYFGTDFQLMGPSYLGELPPDPQLHCCPEDNRIRENEVARKDWLWDFV